MCGGRAHRNDFFECHFSHDLYNVLKHLSLDSQTCGHPCSWGAVGPPLWGAVGPPPKCGSAVSEYDPRFAGLFRINIVRHYFVPIMWICNRN